MKPSNPFTNYSTAQSLGYEDPDAERIAAQLELRRSQGVAGEWQIITPPQAPVPSSSSTEPAPANEEDKNSSLKREAEVPPEEDTRSFKLRKKSLNPGLGEIYDPGLISIKVKKEEAIKQGDSSSSLTTATLMPVLDAGSPSTPSSKWAKPQWSAPLPDIKLEERGKIFGLTEEQTDATEDTSSTGKEPKIKGEPGIKTEDDQPHPDTSNTLTGSLFKKRKTPAGAGKGRRQI
jgi:WW domain-binding protein 4